MMALPSRSPLVIEQQADGRISAAGMPGIRLIVHEQQDELRDDWERQLGFPTYFEDWDRLAQSVGWSSRSFLCVLADSGPTKLQGHLRFHPERLGLPVPVIRLTIGHRPFIVGMVNWFGVVYPEARAGFAAGGIILPEETEGVCLVAQARLYQSILADLAWTGITRGVLTHMCAVIGLPDARTGPEGWIVEVSLTSAHASNPRARILSFADTPLFST